MRSATIRLQTLRTSFVNLPLSLYGPLAEKSIAPQSLVVSLTWTNPQDGSKARAHVGWSGMPARLASIGAASTQHHRQTPASLENVEIDPQFAQELGLKEGQQVRLPIFYVCSVFN